MKGGGGGEGGGDVTCRRAGVDCMWEKENNNFGLGGCG